MQVQCTCSHVYSGEAVSNSCAPVQARIGKAHDLKQPAQNVQHRRPLTEDERPAALALQQNLC